ncbi:MAG TPA: UvrD-helicase domain-containing protein, partial [Kofleriaceae bacterium]|nr:UvrD-helicase domain-containing protein [Kofleriaceae bacterium]
MVDLGKLNPPQREAASHGGGPLLVLAGAGSGKTRVITYRIAHLLALGIPPGAICAVTFTNKAAAEMRERVAGLVNDRAAVRQLTIGTFHALGLQILQIERKALGLPRGFTIYDQADQLGAVREAMRALHDGDRRYDVKALLTRISLAKNAFIGPHDYLPNPADDYDVQAAQVYPRYQELMRSCAAFDFDDLIVEPVRLFERDPAVHRRWAERFRFVMVDEFQDTNAAQLRLVKHLVVDHQNLVVVGDDDQSIYSWRGADPTNILQFDRVFPGAKIVKLEQNYRSTKNVLAAANTVIANNKDRHGKTLWSQHAEGDKITHAVAATAEDEAKWVAREIRELQREGRRWSDIAILYRSNIQAKVLEEELRTAEVPYVMYGGQQFFERKEVKDVIAYLRVALNPRDELALRRVINYPARGIGATTIERLVLASQANHVTLWETLKAAAQAGVHPAACTAIDAFVAIVERTAASFEAGIDVVTATKALIEDIGLYDDLRAAAPSMSAAQRRIDNVTGLLGSLERWSQKGKGSRQLAEFLRALSLDTGNDEKHDDRGEKVVLTTLHGAKGLEFPVCFMIGLEEELLPHARTLQPQATDVIVPAGAGRSESDPLQFGADHATDISEERRLCYV